MQAVKFGSLSFQQTPEKVTFTLKPGDGNNLIYEGLEEAGSSDLVAFSGIENFMADLVSEDLETKRLAKSLLGRLLHFAVKDLQGFSGLKAFMDRNNGYNAVQIDHVAPGADGEVVCFIEFRQ